MDVIEVIRSRRSIRKYKPTGIPDDLIQKVLNSARLAPSGDNTQPWYFIVVRDKELDRKFQMVNHGQKWLSGVPAFIVCVADLRARIKDSGNEMIDDNSPDPDVKKIIRDTAIAADHLVLAAESLGLSTCWLAWFEQKDIRPLFDIPDDKFVVAVIALGYGDEKPAPRPRRKLEDMVYYEKWGRGSALDDKHRNKSKMCRYGTHRRDSNIS